jgi:hypothetical protein
MHAHAGVGESERQRIELVLRAQSGIAKTGCRPLKEVRAGGFVVAAEVGRPNHQHGARGLRFFGRRRPRR